tara:strand:+ start:465 stop:1076 length:612 start_codon:yes stop_codon:yes gene_type:complete
MEYEEYLAQQTLLETPDEVSNLLKSLSGIDVFQQTRKRHVIEHRSLLCYILRTKLDMRWESIKKFIESKGKPYDHATAIHAVKMYSVYKKDNKKLLELESHFIVRNRIEYNQISAMEVMQKKHIRLEKDYFKSLEKIDSYKKSSDSLGLTQNEKTYRTLSRKEKEAYDERASLVLKSFKWKARNEEAEVITCGGGGLDARGVL